MAKKAKNAVKFVCNECGYETPKWMGKCPSCMEWNTIIEEANVIVTKSERKGLGGEGKKPIKINDVNTETEDRLYTGIIELNRVLGGGIVTGSLILVGGDPGIGKSTLLLQVCQNIKKNLLYVSGEESIQQIKIRSNRLNVSNENILIISETDFSAVENAINQTNPQVVIIDSIQTMYVSTISSAPGSVSQVREVTANLMRIAKSSGIAIIVVGHVTKEGSIAGPRVLEHMVDTVLYFEGERHQNFRILRAVKNRFGSTNEIGVFEMTDSGLNEINNPSGLMMEGRIDGQAGSVVTVSMEGTRPMLIEIQSLVTQTSFGMPRRMATGADYNRLVIIIAVLEKKLGMPLSGFDAYINVIGGIKINEPACDLAIAAAVISSFKNIAIPHKTVLIGEVGLTGEVRSVNRIIGRIKEAERMGFDKCIIPKVSMDAVKRELKNSSIIIEPVIDIIEAMDVLF